MRDQLNRDGMIDQSVLLLRSIDLFGDSPFIDLMSITIL